MIIDYENNTTINFNRLSSSIYLFRIINAQPIYILAASQRLIKPSEMNYKNHLTYRLCI